MHVVGWVFAAVAIGVAAVGIPVTLVLAVAIIWHGLGSDN